MAKGLKIKANYTEAGIRAYTNTVLNQYFNHVVRLYSKAGKAMVEDARGRTKDLSAYNGGSFGNITWNLRSSICCAVYRDGVQVYFYGPVLQTGSEGVQKAKDYLDELSQGLDGIVLIVVAGMEYARAVESKGYNVIDATANMAETILEGFINQAA
jgi:hypothetical protein